MWPQNAFTDRLNLKWPILQAPMGWLSTPALAAAVSNAGGLGGLGMWGFSAEEAERRIAGFQQLSGGSLEEATLRSAAARLDAEAALAFVDAIEQSPQTAPAHLVEEMLAADRAGRDGFGAEARRRNVGYSGR